MALKARCEFGSRALDPAFKDLIVRRQREGILKKPLAVAAAELKIVVAKASRNESPKATEQAARDAITLLLAVWRDPARADQITAAVVSLGREHDFVRLEAGLGNQGGHERRKAAHEVRNRPALRGNGSQLGERRNHDDRAINLSESWLDRLAQLTTIFQ